MTADFVLTTTSFLAQAADATNGQQAPAWVQFVPFIFIIAIFYFVLIRPQMKAKKEQEILISSAKTGDKVITSGGLVGVISNVKDKTVIVKVGDVKLEVLKTHLTTITKPENATSES
ncbi:MAG: preprotein translocase subunit YajC [Verrucomicrobia bacterium Tous-C9LFEB]|nr:MAG: preprotein translocase subunit YajC [Verrucomicrobia bacterium Tous-C9LFEB]